jgi:carbamoyltransferase
MTAILGISAFYHDSAAAIVVDGMLVAAAQEERFTRKKHDPDFPRRAVEYCLREAGIGANQLDYVAFYDKPFTKFERLLETYLAFAPRGLRSFSMAIPVWLKDKLFLRRRIRAEIPGTQAPLVFLDHHESHAASAFFPSPFEEAAILTMDGVGEWSTTCWGQAAGNKLALTHHLQFPHSLGLLYSAFTYYCGFKVNSGEYKLMGLAPYGKPIYQDAIYKHLVDLKPDGSIWLNMDYFEYCHGLAMTNRRFASLFGRPPRDPESNLEQIHMDLAASIQAVTEEAVLRMARCIHQETKQKNLVMAGGVALNCVANGRLLREGPFENLWIQPAAGDAGGALGAAQFVWYQLLGNHREPNPGDGQRGSLLGPQYSSEEIRAFLNQVEAPFHAFDSEEEFRAHAVSLLAAEKVIGWFQGRMEFGPRALGSRSIIGDARSPRMQSIMNLKIKMRESFRPFAPIVAREHAADWFDIRPDQESPYMLLVAPVRESRRTPIAPDLQERMQTDPDLRRRVNVVRSSVPAITHVDYSARLQTVDQVRNPRLWQLLNDYHDATGCPVLVNTSFNVRGEPIVCTPRDAFRCFMATEMDALVLENVVLHKEEMDPRSVYSNREEYLAQFQLD